MTSRVFCCQQVDDVPPYITVPPYTSTVWGVSAPEAFYPKNSVAQQADVSQPYGGGSPAMGGWFSAVCYTFGRRYEFMITICYLYFYLCMGEYTDRVFCVLFVTGCTGTSTAPCPSGWWTRVGAERRSNPSRRPPPW